jgi:TonB family protein
MRLAIITAFLAPLLAAAQAVPPAAEKVRRLPLTAEPMGHLPEAPRVIVQPTVAYAPEDAALKAKGVMLVTFSIDARGVPTDVKPIADVGPNFDRQAKPTLLKWRFVPPLSRGKAVASKLTVPVKFTVPAKK